ncbi:charged multivesicular body protein 2b [Salmo salar]|uniref:Charged multivesicular body protein 2b n=1 Tax=Salmo salar TaxID=8030 RepID=A0ABM3DP93_SALSA|nr:charged multivesicular body protein 2b [Salmo salar]
MSCEGLEQIDQEISACCYSYSLAAHGLEAHTLYLGLVFGFSFNLCTMASLFKKKTVDDIIKEQAKELRGTQRQITRDRAALEKQEKQMEMEIKKMAKSGNREACKILAKQLVQLRKQKNRTYAVSSKVTSMSTQTKVMNSQMKMAGAMSTTAKTMQAVNKKMDPQKTLQTMQDFQKENMKMGMTEDMINDTLDEIFVESGDEEESQDIVNQVLDEIGIEIAGKMVRAPAAGKSLPTASPKRKTQISDDEIERQLRALGVD